MPGNRRDRAGQAGPSGTSARYSGCNQDIKPRVKAQSNDNIIDLCDSDEDTPRKPAPSKPAARSIRKDRASRKYKDDDDDDDDDFRSTTTKRRLKPPPSASTSKLYALARIATLATDGVASVSDSEAKLASVTPGILSRIQKSLALAKHPGTGEAEAQQALRLATRLMSSQNLTQADLLASSDAETNQAQAGMSIVEIVSQTNAAPRNESWVNQVAIAVNLFFDVKAYSTSYANRTKLSWTFYGLAINTVAAAHAFEMVHNQVLTWAFDKAASRLVVGKTGKNSYCQGVAAGLIALAKREKKEEMRLAIESENKRLRDAEVHEREQVNKEKDRLDPSIKVESQRVKLEPNEEVGQRGARNVKLEHVEEDIKPNWTGLKRSASEEEPDCDRWTQHGAAKVEPDLGYDSDTNNLDDYYPTPNLDLEEDIKPHFDETLEHDIIDLTDDLDIKAKVESEDIKPKREPKSESEDQGAGWASGHQLIRFRQDAEKIADDYLASQHGALKLKKRAKSTYKKDSSAFEQGREDANKIDVKRKRIQS